MNYEKTKNSLKSDKSMFDKHNSLNFSFVKLICHLVKLFAIERVREYKTQKTHRLWKDYM